MTIINPNEFSLRAEQASISGQYLKVACKCGWRGTRGQLLSTHTKDRACPICRAKFRRFNHSENQSVGAEESRQG
jgi:hypothetical protein